MAKRGKIMYNMMEKRNADNRINVFANEKKVNSDLAKIAVSTGMTQTITSGIYQMTDSMTDAIMEGFLNGRREQRRA